MGKRKHPWERKSTSKNRAPYLNRCLRYHQAEARAAQRRQERKNESD